MQSRICLEELEESAVVMVLCRVCVSKYCQQLLHLCQVLASAICLRYYILGDDCLSIVARKKEIPKGRLIVIFMARDTSPLQVPFLPVVFDLFRRYAGKFISEPSSYLVDFSARANSTQVRMDRYSHQDELEAGHISDSGILGLVQIVLFYSTN